MARCVICDKSDLGLSEFRPDGSYYSRHFHEGQDGRIYCDECDSSYSELMSDYFDSDLEREEQDDAYEYEDEYGYESDSKIGDD